MQNLPVAVTVSLSKTPLWKKLEATVRKMRFPRIIKVNDAASPTDVMLKRDTYLPMHFSSECGYYLILCSITNGMPGRALYVWECLRAFMRTCASRRTNLYNNRINSVHYCDRGIINHQTYVNSVINDKRPALLSAI